MRRSAHLQALLSLGLEEHHAQALAVYLDLVEHWARRVNLTGARTPEERVAVLVAPILPALPALGGAGDLIDLGSGNGSPGLVLALLTAGLRVRLLEPRTHRWAFLREAARATGAVGVEVFRERHDQHQGPPAECLSLRALRLPLEQLEPLLRPGGRVLSWGPARAPGPGWRVSSQASGFQALERCFT